MRDFFVLIHDDRDDLEAVADYETDEFDVMTFWTGKPFKGSIPNSLRIWVDEGKPTDYMGNPMSWQIVSKRFWSSLHALVEKHCQHFEISLRKERTQEPISEYLLLNPVQCISAVKRDSGDEDLCITDLVLDASKIPQDVHLFRLAESSTVIIVSDEVLTIAKENELIGMAFVRTKRA